MRKLFVGLITIILTNAMAIALEPLGDHSFVHCTYPETILDRLGVIKECVKEGRLGWPGALKCIVFFFHRDLVSVHRDGDHWDADSDIFYYSSSLPCLLNHSDDHLRKKLIKQLEQLEQSTIKPQGIRKKLWRKFFSIKCPYLEYAEGLKKIFEQANAKNPIFDNELKCIRCDSKYWPVPQEAWNAVPTPMNT